ncbi:hypothetical protein B0O80DRAFT_425146 [Mortierella sp. GBAus27b]|nr:hypothetical protein B0O80DRAFT_425146 [Mortierella sp. GBAus27b]
MTSRTPDSWDWGKIDIIDLQLDVQDKDRGIVSLSENPYPFLNSPLILEKAHQVLVLKTSSIETISMFGNGLRNLTTLEYNIHLDTVTGGSHQWILDHTDRINDLPPSMFEPLRSWSRRMKAYDDRATDILTNVLGNNRDLVTVSLQLQENHSYQGLVSRLATLENLGMLTIRGSDLHEADDALLLSATETVLDILQRCRALTSLTFGTIPILPSALNYQQTNFTSSITVLDFSRDIHGRARDLNVDISARLHVHRIVPHCPGLRNLSMPRDLPEEELVALTPILGPSCPRLGYLYFCDTDLDVSPFMGFLGSIGTLSTLSLTDCQFSANDFLPWLSRQDVRESFQSLFLEYEKLDRSPQCGELMSIMPPGAVDMALSSWFRG